MNFGAIYGIVLTVLLIVAFVRLRKRRGRLGAGAAGTIYDMINEEKRNAIEIIVEERAAERDPEDRDGNLPALQNPKR